MEKKITRKCWAIVDKQKLTPRLCYSNSKGTISYRKHETAIYFKKPTLKYSPWSPYKEVVPCEITFSVKVKK